MIKVHGGPYQQAGIPDLIGCWQGLFIAFEVKVPARANNVTKLQQKTIDEINAAGGQATVVTSVEEAMAVMEDIRANSI